MLKVALLDTRASAELPASSQQALLPQQLSYYHGLKSAKRRKEYGFSRSLLNLVIQTHLPTVSLASSYQDTQSGPRLSNTDHYISISHSNGVIAIVVASEPVGIDIEMMKPRNNLVELAGLFMEPAELDGFMVLDSSLQQFSFYKNWAGKEAIYKSLPTSNQKVLSLADINHNDFLQSGRLVTSSCLDNQFIMSVALRRVSHK